MKNALLAGPAGFLCMSACVHACDPAAPCPNVLVICVDDMAHAGGILKRLGYGRTMGSDCSHTGVFDPPKPVPLSAMKTAVSPWCVF